MLFKNTQRLSDLLHGLNISQRVIIAIILRETKTRFGKNKLGYLWAIIEPSAYVALLLFIRDKMHASIPFGENLFLFLLTGILVYRVFISVAGRALNAISANHALLTYPLVKPLDTIFARIILEIITMLIVLTIFFLLLSVFSNYTIIHHPQRFAFAICALMFLSTGVGVLNAVVSVILPTWERFWGLIKFPLLILSGVFYIPKSMPPMVQNILVWNPILNCVEWIRSASYLDYDPLLDKSYVLWFSSICLCLGLVLERKYRNTLVRS